MKELPYKVRYKQYRNKIQESNILMVDVYYNNEYVETIAYGNGKKLSI